MTIILNKRMIHILTLNSFTAKMIVSANRKALHKV